MANAITTVCQSEVTTVWQSLSLCCLLIAASLSLTSCQNKPPVPAGVKVATMRVSSTMFAHEGMIPKTYGCAGKNISPPLNWEGTPAGTKSLALICEDPDAPAGLWVHWLLYNLPAGTTSLPEAVPEGVTLDSGARQGVNSSRYHRYDGPCPPSGTHRYYFKLYALDIMLEPNPKMTRDSLLRVMSGHILTQGELMGRYVKE